MMGRGMESKEMMAPIQSITILFTLKSPLRPINTLINNYPRPPTKKYNCGKVNKLNTYC
jgi:hypothetical protein